MSVDTLFVPTDGRDSAEATGTLGVTPPAQLDEPVHCVSVADTGAPKDLDSVLGELEAAVSVEDRRKRAGDHDGQMGETASDRSLELGGATNETDLGEEIVDDVDVHDAHAGLETNDHPEAPDPGGNE